MIHQGIGDTSAVGGSFLRRRRGCRIGVDDGAFGIVCLRFKTCSTPVPGRSSNHSQARRSIFRDITVCAHQGQIFASLPGLSARDRKDPGGWVRGHRLPICDGAAGAREFIKCLRPPGARVADVEFPFHAFQQHLPIRDHAEIDRPILDFPAHLCRDPLGRHQSRSQSRQSRSEGSGILRTAEDSPTFHHSVTWVLLLTCTPMLATSVIRQGRSGFVLPRPRTQKPQRQLES